LVLLFISGEFSRSFKRNTNGHIQRGIDR
jgi:hypothetical protein